MLVCRHEEDFIAANEYRHYALIQNIKNKIIMIASSDYESFNDAHTA